MDRELILVTGGEGFIGHYVRQALLAKGAIVISADLKPPDQISGHCYCCDITAGKQVDELFDTHQISGVVHLASWLRAASIENPLRATQANVLGTLNILEAARKFHVRRVVYASSASIYGSKAHNRNISEEESTSPEDLYGASKKYSELLGQTYMRNYGIEFVALRIPIVIGAGSTATSSPWRSDIFESLAAGHKQQIAIPFKEDETLTLVHVEDLADAILRLVEVESLSCTCYNAPGEIWQLNVLKKEVQTLNTKLDIRFGEVVVSGFPRRMTSDRFKKDCNYLPKPIKTRLRDALRPAGVL